MKSKKTTIWFLCALTIILAGALGVFSVRWNCDVQDMTAEVDEASADYATMSSEMMKSNETIEGVTEHELTLLPVSENISGDDLDAYSAFGVESGQYVLSDDTYEIKMETDSLEFFINWVPMGNYIRVGLINADKDDMYFVSCISGRTEGAIDITQIPDGDYYVVVYNETYSPIDLSGTIAYKFS